MNQDIEIDSEKCYLISQLKMDFGSLNEFGEFFPTRAAQVIDSINEKVAAGEVTLKELNIDEGQISYVQDLALRVALSRSKDVLSYQREQVIFSMVDDWNLSHPWEELDPSRPVDEEDLEVIWRAAKHMDIPREELIAYHAQIYRHMREFGAVDQAEA